MKAYKITDLNDRSIFAIGEYRLVYKDGTIVEAPEGTLGIMCFRSIEDLHKFLTTMKKGIRCKIKRVEDISDKLSPVHSEPNRICPFPEGLWKFYGNGYTPTILPPDGTVCFQRIKVIKTVTIYNFYSLEYTS